MKTEQLASSVSLASGPQDSFNGGYIYSFSNLLIPFTCEFLSNQNKGWFPNCT
jgi:hypothetical protein